MTKLTAQRALDAPGLESSKDFDGRSHVAIIIYPYVLRMSWVWGMLTCWVCVLLESRFTFLLVHSIASRAGRAGRSINGDKRLTRKAKLAQEQVSPKPAHELEPRKDSIGQASGWRASHRSDDRQRVRL
jgi:hypothetical protein